MVAERSHEELAHQLRQRVVHAGVVIDEALREGALRRGGGDPAPLTEPYESLVRQIAEASYRVTDEQVDAVRAATGSEKAAFEVVMSAGIGAGLKRWDAALLAIEEARDAAP